MQSNDSSLRRARIACFTIAFGVSVATALCAGAIQLHESGWVLLVILSVVALATWQIVLRLWRSFGCSPPMVRPATPVNEIDNIGRLAKAISIASVFLLGLLMLIGYLASAKIKPLVFAAFFAAGLLYVYLARRSGAHFVVKRLPPAK